MGILATCSGAMFISSLCSSIAVDCGASHAEPQLAGTGVAAGGRELQPPRGAHPSHTGRRPQLQGEGWPARAC